MRRKDRQVTDPEKIDSIIAQCHCCRLGFSDGQQVYVVPLSFGYEKTGGKRIFYFHGAPEGRKLELVKTGRPVGLELDCRYRLREGETACGFTARFQSVIATGIPRLLEKPQEKVHGLRQIMRHYTGKTDWEFPPAVLEKTCVFQVEVLELSCKEHQ